MGDFREGKEYDALKKMSKADLMKKYGPKILNLYGADELRSVKENTTGPGGVDALRTYIFDIGFNKGGMVKKKKLSQGGVPMKGKTKMASKKMMRGGMAAKTAPKRMRGGGMAKMAKKKMMRGGMAKKK